MSPVYSQIIYAFAAAVLSGVGAALLALIPKGIAYLEEMARAIPDAQERNAVTAALADLQGVVTSVVASLDQTTVGALKAASATGKLTAEQATQVKADATSAIDSIMSVQAKNLLASNFGDLPSLISHLIEQAVLGLKGAKVGG